MKYVALLRGVNVGGNNIIKMIDLKACFEGTGLMNVATYIQSGNVLFETPERDVIKLTDRIEKALTKRFNYKSRVVIVSRQELKDVVKCAPPGFGDDAAKYKYDVIFLKRPLSAREAIHNVSTKEGVDQAYAGKSVLYFSRLTSKASQSRLAKIIQLPIYQDMTIRNWNTTTKLLALMEGV